MHNAILTLLSVVFLGLTALLIRPQLAARFGRNVPPRRKLILPFAACLILVAVLDNATPHHSSDDGDSNTGTSESTLVGKWNCISPDHPGAPEEVDEFSQTNFSLENGEVWGSYRLAGSRMLLNVNFRASNTGQIITSSNTGTISQLDASHLVYTIYFRHSQQTESCTRA
jgi:hypothetical protein